MYLIAPRSKEKEKKKGMTLEKDISMEDATKLVKKPTKWMRNSPVLAKLLQARCNGQHEHEKLEGSARTKQAESYPVPLVKAILNKIHQTKRMKMDANMAKDPLHMQIPAMFSQCEDNIRVKKFVGATGGGGWIYPFGKVSKQSVFQITVLATVFFGAGPLAPESQAHKTPGETSPFRSFLQEGIDLVESDTPTEQYHLFIQQLDGVEHQIFFLPLPWGILWGGQVCRDVTKHAPYILCNTA